MSVRRIRVDGEGAAAEAVRTARELAAAAGLSAADAAAVATAVSEIAANQLRHAGGGMIAIHDEPEGVVVLARDQGPGIPDVRAAMRDGYSTAGSLGLGLPGARRLMDEFTLESAPGRGTTVRMAKRLPSAREPGAVRPIARWGAVGGRLEPVAERWAAGLLLALVPPGAADALRADAAASPPLLVERAGGRDAVVASVSALDGRMVWHSEPEASAVLHRRREGHAAIVASAPRRRAQTVAVLRGDVLVLASFPLAGLPASLPRRPQHIAEAVASLAPVGAPAPAVLCAVFTRGSHDRP